MRVASDTVDVALSLLRRRRIASNGCAAIGMSLLLLAAPSSAQTIKQITQYPLRTPVQSGDNLLLQTGSVGSPYMYAPVSGILGALSAAQIEASLGFTPSNSVITGSIGNCLKIGAGNLLADSGGPCGGSGSPGGTPGQLQFNSAGSFAGVTIGGDATLNTGTGALTVSKIGGDTVTLGGAFTTSGAHALTLTTTATTNVTLPASGTLLTAAGLPVATATALGAVIVPATPGSGSNLLVDGSGNISAPIATASQFGTVKPDGSTITISSGVISAVGGGGGSVNSSASANVPAFYTSAGTAVSPVTVSVARADLGIDQRSQHGSAAVTLAASEHYVTTCNDSNSACSTGTWDAAATWTLPAHTSVNDGTPVQIADDAGVVTNTDSLSVAPSAGDTINGSASPLAINAAYGRVSCIANTVSANWTCSPSFPNGADGTLLIGQAAGTAPAWVTPSGDVSITDLGVTKVTAVNGVPFPAVPPANTVPLNTAFPVPSVTWSSAPTFGTGGSRTGSLGLANGSAGGAVVTVQNPSATGAYNWNLPATAGASGAPLLSGGGASSPMTWGSLSGNTTVFGTTSGSLTSGDCAKFDASGNIVDSGGACGAGGGGSGTVNSGTSGQLAFYGATGTAVSGEAQATVAQGGTGAASGKGAAANLSVTYLVCNAALSSVTGTTTETVIGSCPIPANLIGTHGVIRFGFYGVATSNTNTKTWTVRYGSANNTSGTSCFTQTSNTATVVATYINGLLIAKGATNSQDCDNQLISSGNLTATAVSPTAVDTTAASFLVVTGTLANAADTMTAYAMWAEFLPAGGN